MTPLLILAALAAVLAAALVGIWVGYRMQPPQPQELGDAGLLDVEPAVRSLPTPDADFPNAGRDERGRHAQPLETGWLTRHARSKP